MWRLLHVLVFVFGEEEPLCEMLCCIWSSRWWTDSRKPVMLCGAWYVVQLQGVAAEFWGCIMKMLTCCECWFMHCQCSAVGLPVDKDGVNDWPLGTAWIFGHEIWGSYSSAAESTSLPRCGGVFLGELCLTLWSARLHLQGLLSQ